jgi:hypothetical protein
MVLTSDELQRAEKGILSILEDSDDSYPPAQIMKQLENEGIPNYSIRVAIWYLMDRNLIELTMDRLLKSVRRDYPEPVQQNAALAGG